jgi:hypothetical protein
MLFLIILACFALALAVLTIKAQDAELREKQRIIEGQDELIRKQRILIEEKMTEKVKEAFEKPKRPRKSV